MKLPALGIALALLAGPVMMAADISEVYSNLQQAVEKKDAAQIKKLVADLQPLLKDELAIPAPQGETQKKDWTERMEYVKGIQSYGEYALLAATAGAPPAETVELISTIEKQNPKSKYLNEGYAIYFAALTQSGGASKIPAIAEKALENFPENEDLLSVAAESALAKGQAGRASGYASRLVAAYSRHSKPENMSQAEWDRKKGSGMGRGYFIVGFVAGQSNQFAVADKNLRAALPLIQGNNGMMGPALFYLGVANYNIAKMTNNKAKMMEAARFSDQCAAIPGSLQTQAYNNSALIKKEAAAMR